MFVARATVLLDLLAEQHPELAAGLRAIAADPSTLDDVWPGLEKIAIDHAVAEPAAAEGRVAVVPGTFAWDDIGDFAFLASPADRRGRRWPSSVTATGSSPWTAPVWWCPGDRVVAVVGLEDVVVVDTGDALLVTTLDRAQEVKGVVAALKQRDLHELT